MAERMPEVTATGARVEQLLDELATTGGPALAGCGEQLVRALMGLYGAGLARIMELAGEPVRERFAADRVIAGLLVLHDLHPVPTERRVRGALDRVRAQLGRHSGQVELVSVADGVARVRLAGGGQGCASTVAALEQAIEAAIGTAAPEIDQVVVEGAAPARAEPPLLQIQTGVPR